MKKALTLNGFCAYFYVRSLATRHRRYKFEIRAASDAMAFVYASAVLTSRSFTRCRPSSIRFARSIGGVRLLWRQQMAVTRIRTSGINRRAATSKPTVWRWQERYLDEGVKGLGRDKTRPSRVPPLPQETRLKVIAKTLTEFPSDATNWRRAAMA